MIRLVFKVTDCHDMFSKQSRKRQLEHRKYVPIVGLDGPGEVDNEGEAICAKESSPVEADRFCGEAQGDRGEFGDGEVGCDVTRRKAGPFDGDRDNERRILNGEVGSP